MTRASSHLVRIPAAALVLGTALAAVGLIATPDAAHAATITVDTFGDIVDAGCSVAALPGADGVTSLREAVCAANANPDLDVIQLAAGSYVLNSQLEVTSDIVIVGAGIDATTVSAPVASRVIDAWGFVPISLGLYDVTLRGGDVRGNSFPKGPEGGVLNLFGVTTHLERVRITGGIAQEGGGIANIAGQLTLLDSEVSGNAASTVNGTGLGGGIWSVTNLSSDSFRMQRTIVSGNTAVGNGGGIVLELGNSDRATIEQSTISGNTAMGGAVQGGFGGGLAFDVFHHGTVEVSNSTISGNSAEIDGGAFYHAGDPASSLLLSNATVAGNSATATGGLARVNGFVTVNNSIVAGNTGATPDLTGAITGLRNLIGVAGGGFTDGVADNQVGSAVAPLDALLGPLADNGGPTPTQLPLAGSPALDAAALSCGAVDQRGVSRPQGLACDIGAVELTATETSITSAPAAATATASATFVAAGTGVALPITLECSLDGAAFVPCVSPVTVSGLADGAHTMLIRAVDSFGGTDATPASHNWTVDTTGPTVSWGTVSLGTAAGSTSSFAFTAADALSAVASVECSLDGAAFAVCVSPVAVAGLAAGAHSFQVRAVDDLGNIGPVVEQLWTMSAVPTGTGPGTNELVVTGGDALPGAAAAIVFLALGTLLLLVRRRMALSRG